MYILFGIIASALAVAIEFLCGRYMGFTISGFSYFVVIPLGTIIIGVFVGAMIAKGRVLENKRLVKSQYIFALIIGLLTFVAINYMEYKTTYLSDNYSINRVGDGTPISECSYVDDDENEVEMTFINYEKYKLDNFDSVINGRFLKNQSVSTHGIANYIRYFVKMLGLSLACVCAVFANSKNDIYCNECNKYMKEKKLFKFSQNNHDHVMQTINESNDLQVDLKELINSKWEKDNNPVYYEAVLVYCNRCKKTEIYIKEIKTKNNTEIDENRKIISINNYQSIESLV